MHVAETERRMSALRWRTPVLNADARGLLRKYDEANYAHQLTVPLPFFCALKCTLVHVALFPVRVFAIVRNIVLVTVLVTVLGIVR